MISFDISHWQAWSPQAQTPDAWRQWATHTLAADRPPQMPDAAFLPAMQRRRLSYLARMAFAVAWPLAEVHGPMPLVFVSRHGETPRTFSLLTELAAGQPLSPTQFSLSVHNAVIGLWSILRGDTSEMTAVAAAGDGFEQGLIEAAGLLHDGAPAVLLVVAEEPPPTAYAQWIDDVPFAHALALRVTAGDQWQLAPAGSTASAVEAPPACTLPHALCWLSAELRGERAFTTTWEHRAWQWQRQT